MRKLINAGPALAIMSFFAAVSTHPALAVPAPPSVPEPSPAIAVAIGAAALALALFVKYRFARRAAAKHNA